MGQEGLEMSRRDFIKATGAAVVLTGAGVAATTSESHAQQQPASVPASEKIRVGVIGAAGRGTSVMHGFMKYPDVEIVAICDVYQPHLDRAVASVAERGGKAEGYSDFRKLLERKDIDAVIVATPPHWHPIISILACQAGKDVYCEKPISAYPAENIAMLKAARDNKRVTQVGTQIHAGDNYRRVVEIVQSGALGKISTVRIVCTMNEFPGIGTKADSEPPEGLDWDMWLGPAPKVQFNELRFGVHRYFKDYAPSWLHELGPHIVDLAYWAMNSGWARNEQMYPRAVSASGGRFAVDGTCDIPDTMDVTWEYEGFNMTWMHTMCNSFNFDIGGAPDGGRRLGVLFHGTNGTLLSDYGFHNLVSEGEKMKDFKAPEPSIPSSPGQDREFLDGVKSRKQPLCSFEYHQPLALAFDLANISMLTGRKIHWDAKAGKIVGDRAAERLCMPPYRRPWTLPKV